MPRTYNKGDTLTFRDTNDTIPLDKQEILTGTVHVTVRTRGEKSIYWVVVPERKGDYDPGEYPDTGIGVLDFF